MFAFAFVVGVIVLIVIVVVDVRALIYAWSGRYELDRRLDAATKK